MEFLRYLVEHVESLGKITTYITVVFMVFATAVKRFYFNYRYKTPNKIIKQISYLKKYSNYMSDDDKFYTKERINDEIMRDITKIPTANNRKDIVFIFNNIEKKKYINDICKLQNEIEKIDGHFVVKINSYGIVFFINRFFSLLSGLAFFIFIFLGVVSVVEGKNWWVITAFLFMAILYEYMGLYFFSLSPSKKIINKINLELKKFKHP